MLTLMLAIDFFEFTSERRFVELIRAYYLALFPKLLDQSQYNRRARSLRYVLNELRKDWAAELDVSFERHFLLDKEAARGQWLTPPAPPRFLVQPPGGTSTRRPFPEATRVT